MTLVQQHNIRHATLDTKIGFLSSIVEVDEDLARKILNCESGLTHKTKDNINKDGSKDIGIGQINEKYHGKEMKKAGLNIRDETDNLVYSFYLMGRNNLRDYSASKSCWAKQSIVKANTDT